MRDAIISHKNNYKIAKISEITKNIGRQVKTDERNHRKHEDKKKYKKI